MDSARVEQLFHQLADLSPDERKRILSEEAISPLTRERVETLLAHDGPDGNALEELVQRALSTSLEAAPVTFPRCGAYQLLRLIGHGGMGSVYLAERADGEIRQKVAIKLLRMSVDTAEARHLFQRERQILADLSHPNIAHLLDAGRADDGRPFLAMEYIDGTPIDEYCKGRPLRQRVELVDALCSAIVYAHRMLVVHRDLKPGNTLIDASGAPKLLDFGIAKLMDAAGDETATVERRLTPQYASPEQILGRQVGAASDVFSLASMLYLLITGQPPFRSEDYPNRTELQHAVCEAQVTRPREWNNKIDNDLECIVLKAMRKEPNERYASADAFREDLRAWLEHRPVRARQGNWWYFARRQLRRYWIPVTAAATTFAGLAVGLGIAMHERDIAKRRFEDVHKFANEMLRVGMDIETLPGATPAREQIVKTSLDYLNRLSRDAGNDLNLEMDIGSAYRIIADIQGGIRKTNLGRSDEALSSLQKSERFLQDAWKRQPGDARALRQLMLTIEAEGRLEEGLHHTRGLREKLGELQQLAVTFERIAPNKPSKWGMLSGTYDSLALGSEKAGDVAGGLRFARKSVEFEKKLVSMKDNVYARGNLANSLSSYGLLMRSSGDLNGALRAMREALAIFEQMARSLKDDFILVLDTGSVHASIGSVLAERNELLGGGKEEAISEMKQSLVFFRQNVRLDPSEDEARINLGSTANELGTILQKADPEAALAVYDEAISALRAMPANNARRNFPLSIALSNSVFPLRKIGRGAEGRKRLAEAKQIAGAKSEPGDDARSLLDDPSEAISRAEAEEAAASGNPTEAIRLQETWLRSVESKREPAHFTLPDALAMAARYQTLATWYGPAGRLDEQEQVMRKRQTLLDAWRQKALP